MFRPYPLFIGLRYTRAKRKNHFISFISIVSMVGIALGATVLITVLSVMNGFQEELRSRILGMTSHASILPLADYMDEWPSVASQAIEHPEVLAAAPFVEGEAMLRNGRYFSGVALRGIIPDFEATVSTIPENMTAGKLTDLKSGEYGIVLGIHLANALGVIEGDKVDLMIPKASLTPAGVVPRFRRFIVAGTFDTDMYEYDRSIALLHIEDAQRLYRIKDHVNGVRLKMEDMLAAPRVALEVQNQLDGVFIVQDWTRQHKNFFRAVATEKTVMFLILVLILAIAAFNIVSALVMVVTDKQSDIAVLRTLGSSPSEIMMIFVVQGAVVGVVGTVIGVIGGVLLALNIEHIVPLIEQIAARDLLSPEVYAISELKGVLIVEDVVKIAATCLTFSFLSTLYPAYKAARVQPAEALRYE